MKQQSNRRNRGVILTLKGWDKIQASIKLAESQKDIQSNLTLEELSYRTRLATHTISKILGRKEPVDRSSLQSAFSAFKLELLSSDYTQPSSSLKKQEARQKNSPHDWGEAVDLLVFYGRSVELLQLRQWVLSERCRLVGLLGIGGIGKSSLAVKLGQQVQSEFEAVVWRSLENVPPVEDKLESILRFLLPALRKEIVIPHGFDGKLSKLMECLISNKCLLILDNVEAILFSGGQVGQCRPGYEGYGQLLKSIGEIPHQSCVLLTSREKPREVALLEGEQTGVRTMKLKGLTSAEAQELFRQKGQFTGTEQQWNMLIEHYGGNPLVLKMIAAATQDLFDGRIAGVLDYLKKGILIFEDIRDLLEPQFCRLSAVEQEVMYWLAINRKPVSLADLASKIVTQKQKRHLPQAVTSLLQRSLIEKSGSQFFLQPVVMAYLTQRLIEPDCKEIREPTIQNIQPPHSPLPTPHSPLPTPYSPLPTPHSLLPTPHSPLPNI